MFRKKLLTFIKPLEKDSCGIYDPLGVRLIKIYLSVRTTLMNDLNNINTSIGSLNSNYFLRVILYGKKSLTKKLIARY